MDYKKATQSEIGLEVNLEVFNFVPKNQDVGMFTMLKKSAPGEIRTHGPRIRNPVLYPTELRGRYGQFLPLCLLFCYHLNKPYASNNSHCASNQHRISFRMRDHESIIDQTLSSQDERGA
jgi:hypothetical protein